MRKSFTVLFAVLISVAMWAEQTYCYSGQGNGKAWAKTAMTVSVDGFYEYYHITSTTTHQFKIGTESDQWAYNYTYVSAGFNGTDVTQIGDYGHDNCYCWKGSEHYILVYYPNTTINTSNKPKICASTTLPDNTPAEDITMYFVNVPEWETVKAFVWPATGNAYKEWSGEAMTKTETKVNGYDVYSYTFPSNYVNIIFNDGGSNKTADLAWTANKPYFYPETKDGSGRYNAKWYENTAAIPVPVVPTMKVVKLVPSEEWASNNAKFAAWIWGDNITSQWTAFFTPVSEGNDTLQAEIISTTDSIDFVRFSPKATEPTWTQTGENVLIWGELKDTIDWKGLTYTVKGWSEGTWEPVVKPCESYGLMVGEQFIPGKKNVSQTEWTEYMLRGVQLTQGQRVKLCNACDSYATWVETTFAATSYTFDIEEGAYVIAEDGTYDFYLKFIGFGNNEIFVSKAGTYTTAVRDQCTDVLMQAFYNESYSNSAPGVSDSWAIGDTKWNTLLAQADTLGKYFDLIWLPPSANGDGMGYHPKNYGNQSSNWGTAAELTNLIGALHTAGAKVVADIVINHCQSSTGWMGFPQFDFGTYGQYQPKGAWICKNDEVNSDPGSDSKGLATGPYDDGENWSGARDWAHSNVEVQAMFKAYLKWMRNVVGYDGFRYDKGDGFNNWHHDNYNKSAGPYIAFMECYSNTDEIQYRISQANNNMMALDFDTKWHVFDAFAGWDYDGKYGKARGDGLLGRNQGRYAVTFIDSHDWFLRSDNENEFGGHGNSLTEAMKCRLLQANAFMLSMPGVPCVFYPHWKKYDGFIKPMIEARKLAGVHSESEVKDEYATSTGYQATIVGKDGFLILCLGDKAHQNFDGFTCMASYYETNDCNMGHDASYQIWVKRTTPLPTSVEDVQRDKVQSTKELRDGKLYIRLGDKLYNVLGQTIK